ncbi:hypothetical protein MIMGU_mgv1a001460mg [Erythranthe guttata]|uniref:Uncharacterized protein n=1 Tax=Erythranthe guttata TaxID=4155 RepID=A0A022RVV3_ERYGU|nr:hypothetical protein MIMGU_mgv1a001460mg [Erythranthe guttata]
MLQRQIMFKQLQELQRRQQLQELGNARNQDYVDHQLSSLKQDPQMFSIASEIASDSLDPLEQKILYNTEDNNSWEFSFGGNSKMENTSYMDALPSTQKGSWSALMQSAVTEASSSDTAMQEEWSGLSFQNPELSTENQPSSFVNSENPHNNWVDRNLQNVSSPSSEPSNMNYSPQGFKQPEDCSPGMQLTSKVSSLNQLPLTETSVASIANPCNTSHLESQGFGFRPGPTDVGTTQSHSLFPSFSMGNSNATSVSSHYGNDYIKNQLPAPSVQSHMTTKLPAYNAASSQVNRQLKTASFSGPEFPWSDINSQQDMSSSKPNRFSDSLFQSPDSASSSLETTSGAPSEQPNQSRFKHELNVQEFRTNSGKSGYGEQRFEKESSFDEGSTEMHNPTSLSINMQTQESLRAFGHSLHQNDPLLHKLHSPRNAEIDYGKNLPLKYDSVNYQTIANARELLLSGQKQVLQDSEDKKGWNFSQDKEDHSGKNNAQNNLIGRNEVSNTAYQSPTTLQMSPPWLQHYGTLKNGLTIANVHENSPIMQVNSANASQGSGVWPSSAVALIASQHLSSPSMLPSNVSNYQNLALSKPMKRKIIAFEMVPWHKEVNHQEPRLHNIRMAELEWAQASKRREEEAEIVEDVVPLARAKRRLIFTTQLMQQVFRPAPAVILFADAKSNCDDVAYSAARLALGDACNLISNLPPDNTDISPDKLRTSKKPRVCDLSKVVEGLINRVQKLEGDLSRLDQKISIVDIKVEIQELEKFSTINRFAKFHVKAHSSTVDSTSSSGQSTVQKPNPQRYVRALPLPKTLPEGTDCLSL